jgi:phage/plasmid-associated DNA primase
LNVWKGFAIDNIQVESSKNVEPFLYHLRILVNHDPNNLDFTVKWLAQMVQQPGKLEGIALVFISQEGVGKNLFFTLFMDILGRNYYFETANPEKDLFDRFSLGRLHKLLINIDEAKSKDSYKRSEELKNMITNDTLNYEKKNISPMRDCNTARVVFFSNNSFPVLISANDRRFVVFESSNEMVGNAAYFKELVKYMKDPTNQKAIIEYLRSIDISTVNWIVDRPKTQIYNDIRQQSVDNMLKFLESQYLDYEKTECDGTFKVYANDFLELYKRFMSKRGLDVNISTIAMGRKLQDYMNKHPGAIIRKCNNGHVVKTTYVFVMKELKTMLKSYGLLSELSYMFID